jgi:hypothetical protein
MLSVFYAEGQNEVHCGKCRYYGCRYAECRGAMGIIDLPIQHPYQTASNYKE